MLSFVVVALACLHIGSGQIVDLRTGSDFSTAIVSEIAYRYTSRDLQPVTVSPWLSLSATDSNSRCDFSNTVIRGLRQKTESDFKTLFENHVHTFQGTYTFPSVTIQGNIMCTLSGTTYTGDFEVKQTNIQWPITVTVDIHKFNLGLNWETFAASADSVNTVTVNSDVMSTPMGADIEAEMQHVVVETLNALVHTPQENFNNAKRDASQCQHVL